MGRGLSNTAKHINSSIGRAINDHDLINDGDRILVAVSGGKDSLTLLDFLMKIKSWAPVKFDVLVAHVVTDFRCGGCAHTDKLTKVFEEKGVEYRFIDVKVLDDEGKTSCFWCSWNRRKALFKLADELGCGKVALGHHKDDIVETTLMNLLYLGEFSSMNPRQELFGGKITLIRPLCYVEEKDIKGYAKEAGFPQQLCKCPYGNTSRRKFVKELIKNIQKENPRLNVKTNIYNAPSRIKHEYLDLMEADPGPAIP